MYAHVGLSHGDSRVALYALTNYLLLTGEVKLPNAVEYVFNGNLLFIQFLFLFSTPPLPLPFLPLNAFSRITVFY